MIDPRFYRRTLFAGLDVAPAVLETGVLMVADRDATRTHAGRYDVDLAAKQSPWSAVPPHRALAVVSHADIRRVPHAGIAVTSLSPFNSAQSGPKWRPSRNGSRSTSTTSSKPTRLIPVVQDVSGRARDPRASLTLT